MSAIQKSLVKFLELDAPGADRQAFLAKVMKEVQELSNDDWDKLSVEEQDWFNAAVDAKNAKASAIPDFPDYEAPKEEGSTRRRRASGDDDGGSKGGTGTREVKESELKEGMALRVVTKRGTDVSGHVVEVGKGFVALKTGDGKEKEFDFDQIETMTSLAEAGGSAEPEDPMKVGAKVKIITKRGREAEGEIIELTKSLIAIKDADGKEKEFDLDQIGSCEPLEAAKAETPARRGRSTEKGDEKPAAEGKGKRSSNEGVSVSQRVTELVLDDLKATEEQIGEQLKKEKLEFRDNTLKLNYAATHKFVEIAKAKKLLKV